MFNRVDMHVIHVRDEICFVANQVLPITPLQMPRSPRLARIFEIRSVRGNAFEKFILIKRQRTAKSASPSGNSIIQCTWSGRTTQP